MSHNTEDLEDKIFMKRKNDEGKSVSSMNDFGPESNSEEVEGSNELN